MDVCFDSLAKYLGVTLLAHVVILHLTFFQECHTVFQSGCTILHSHRILHFMHFTVEGHLGHFQSLTVTDNDFMNIPL